MSDNIKETETVKLTVVTIGSLAQVLSLIEQKNMTIEYCRRHPEASEASCREMVVHYNDMIKKLLDL